MRLLPWYKMWMRFHTKMQDGSLNLIEAILGGGQVRKTNKNDDVDEFAGILDGSD